jgi:hypothetical protein
VERADHLAAELHQAAVGERRLLDPTARPVARLEHEHVGTAAGELAGSGEPRQAGAQHHDVVAH